MGYGITHCLGTIEEDGSTWQPGRWELSMDDIPNCYWTPVSCIWEDSRGCGGKKTIMEVDAKEHVIEALGLVWKFT